MKALKSLGQHFLVNTTRAEQMVLAIDNPESWDIIVEIGPGKGVLTDYLYPIFKSRLVLIELDRRPVEMLREKYTEATVIEGDFLKMDLRKFETNKILIIGNFPYNISSQILFKMIDNRDIVGGMIGMFQKEVAERIISSPNSKEFGILSVMAQSYYHGKILFKLSPGSFNPPPKVDSAVIKLSRNTELKLPCNEVLFKQIVKMSFNQRRKMLRSSIKQLTKGNENPILTQRPEQLDLKSFYSLTNWIESLQK